MNTHVNDILNPTYTEPEMLEQIMLDNGPVPKKHRPPTRNRESPERWKRQKAKTKMARKSRNRNRHR